MTKSKIPKSCTDSKSVWLGFSGLILSLAFVRYFGEVPTYAALFIVLCATAVPMMLYDFFYLKVYRRSSSGLDYLQNNFNRERSLIKVAGLLGTLCIIAFLYWIFPEYHGHFYKTWWKYLAYFGPFFAIICLPYIFIVDSKMQEPQDGLWHAGLFFQGRFSEVNFKKLKEHSLGWLVKGFFLPLMVNYSVNNLEGFLSFNWESKEALFYFHRIHDFIYLIDLIFVVIGYTVSLRIFDSHIRSTESTFFGWAVALFCYQPFWGHFGKLYLQYSDGRVWTNIFTHGSPAFYFWGITILLLISFYSLSSLYFGLRFSNLTNRGIITNGPFAYTKHPAYVSKNISWWLISMPFMIGADWQLAIRQSLMLILLNFVYYLRAKTEEKHLSCDPDYVKYALAMNERSLFRWIPFFKYSGPNITRKKS